MKNNYKYAIYNLKNKLHKPKFNIGDLVYSIHDNTKSSMEIQSIVWYEGMQYFTYWLIDGPGVDIPEDELIK